MKLASPLCRLHRVLYPIVQQTGIQPTCRSKKNHENAHEYVLQDVRLRQVRQSPAWVVVEVEEYRTNGHDKYPVGDAYALWRPGASHLCTRYM
jgi:hypothetical protein